MTPAKKTRQQKKSEREKKTKNQKKYVIPRTSLIITEKAIAEQITTNEGPRFAIWEPSKGDDQEWEQANSFGGYLPIDDDAVKENAVIFPTGVTRYKNEQWLIQQIQEHIHKWLDISPHMETIATHYILLSWLYERTRSLCYLRALGDTGTGKSRFLDVIGRLCYKPIIISGAVTPAPIYRLIKTFKGTIIIDEADWDKSDEKNEVITILNCGFERGRPVVRCDKNNPDKVQTFNTYCPKVIATRKGFDDKALESRCLTEVMKETDREIPVVLTTEFFKEEERLRRYLLCFRMRKQFIPWYPPNEEDKEFNEKVEPRLRQSTQSMIQNLQPLPEVKKKFKTFLIGYSDTLRNERAQSYDGVIVNYVLGLFDANKDTKITARDIAEHMTATGFGKATPQSVGRRLRSLGIVSVLTRLDSGEVKRIIEFDGLLFKRLAKKYKEKICNSVTNVTTHKESPTQKRLITAPQDRAPIYNKFNTYPHSVVTNVTPLQSNGCNGCNDCKNKKNVELLNLCLNCCRDRILTDLATNGPIEEDKLIFKYGDGVYKLLRKMAVVGDVFEPMSGLWGRL